MNNLKTLLLNLENEPTIIVCSEARLTHMIGFIELDQYELANNKSVIYKADGVVLYVIATSKLNEIESLKISSNYRCHNLNTEEFLKGIDVGIY